MFSVVSVRFYIEVEKYMSWELKVVRNRFKNCLLDLNLLRVILVEMGIWGWLGIGV